MYAAVAQLAVVQVGLLCPLTCQLGDASHRLTLPLALLNLLLQDVGTVFLVDVQVVVDLTLEEVADILIDGLAIGRHERAAQLNLGLALEDRLLDIDGYGSHNTVADVGILVALVEEFLDGLGDVLLERTLVGTALSGVLAVDERVVFLSILVGMGEGNLYILADDMHDGIESVVGHIVIEKVLQSVAALYPASVVHDGKTGIEVSIVAQHGFHNLVVEGIVLEEGVVGLEVD